MTNSIISIIVLGVIAGGGIIVIDYFVLRRIRRQAKDEPDRSEKAD